MKILVIRFSSLGDVILVTPFLQALKRLRPHAHVTVLTKISYAGVFHGNPHLDELIAWEPDKESLWNLIRKIRYEKYDLIIDLHNNPRSSIIRLFSGAHRRIVYTKNIIARNLLVWFKIRAACLKKNVVERYLDTLKNPPFHPFHPLFPSPFKGEGGGEGAPLSELFPNPDGNYILAGAGIQIADKLVGLSPGAKHATKMWPVENFAQAATILARELKAKIIITGDSQDKSVAEKTASLIPEDIATFNFAGKISLVELMGIIGRLSIFISNDSGPMHIADALGVPLVAIFGPTVKEFGFSPQGKSSRIIETELPCRPCSLHGSKTCPLGHHNCINLISPEQVITTAKELLKDKIQLKLLQVKV